ncbi:hypothetical protein DFR52_102878 [Hoeflea marina]|uniref:Uncharacterized protein n=1 Tax=Hoeflea marina TaxID=274592 RepID=A0A317PRM2_9HYPH|nr:DUF6107 family protein [Hoeflea marina]PWW02210.1 hypothetical protein DFR52_102878 [Hoeflea marina]
MNPLGFDPTMIAARIAGAVAGALVSLAYMLPKGRREAATRGFAGLASGLVFGGPAGVVLAQRLGVVEDLSRPEILMMGAAAASMSAWWSLGVLARIADRLGRGKGG